MILVNFFFKVLYKLKLYRVLQLLDKRFKYTTKVDLNKKQVVFCGPITPWGDLHQRPQNFAKALVESGFEVIYCIEPYTKHKIDSEVFGFKNVDGVNLLTSMREWHLHIDRVDYLYTCYPWQLTEAKKLKKKYPNLVHIHDVFDDVSIFTTKRSDIDAYNYLLNTSNKSLYSADCLKPKKNEEDALYVPNGCDIKHFYSDEKDLIIGYVGAIDTWFDFKFVEEMSKELPHCTFLLVGGCNVKVSAYLNTLIGNSTNIYYLGKIAYRKLPSLLKTFDYSLIPFIINEITLATSPIKMFEYLAAGTNVISTRLPEVNKYKDAVFIVDNPKEAVDVIKKEAKIPHIIKSNVVAEASWEYRLRNVFK